MCSCHGTGYVNEQICVNHLEEAFNTAIVNNDKELAAVIALKKLGKL